MNNIFEKKRVAFLDIHSVLYLRSKNSKVCGGDLSDFAVLIERSAAAGFAGIMMTPIQDTGLSPCPYMGISIFSFNPVFLSVKWLQKDLEVDEIRTKAGPWLDKKDGIVNYRKLYKYKLAVLKEVFEKSGAEKKIKIEDFTKRAVLFAVFSVLKNKFKVSWNKWPREYRKGEARKIIKNHPEFVSEIKFVLFSQKVMLFQWKKVAGLAKEKGLFLMLDKPIYPVFGSADVWANQELFYLTKKGKLKYESGCNNPRDPFGPQRWGHAVYQFLEKESLVIDFFSESIRFMSQVSKVIRLDHTLALIWKYYIINPKTGKGRHRKAIGDKLFSHLKKEFPDIFFVAEDVGYVSKKNVDLPMLAQGLPGMLCMQWTNKKKYTDFSKYPILSMALTSNHDLPSVPKWQNGLNKKERAMFSEKLKEKLSHLPEKSTYQLIRLVFESPSMMASVSMRDLVFDIRRQNHPSTKNYRDWKLNMAENIEDVDFSEIKKIIKESGR